MSRIETRSTLMMSISAIRATAPVSPTLHPMRRAGDAAAGREQTVASGTPQVALTRTEPLVRVAPASLRTNRPDASFVTHLLATAEQVPQTRELRRAAVADVEAAYRSASAYSAGASINRVQRTV